MAISDLWADYVQKKVAVLAPGPKGFMALKGTVRQVRDGFLELETDKGMMSKPKRMLISLNGIIAVRLEED